MECDICIRNSKNVSIKFQPVNYKGRIIQKPIDMYISRELMDILREEIRKMYEEGLRRGQKPPGDIDPGNWSPYMPKWWWSQGSQQFIGTSYNSGDTISLVYTVSIPTEIPIKIDATGVSFKAKKEKNVIKTACVDISELLGDLEGIEVGETD